MRKRVLLYAAAAAVLLWVCAPRRAGCGEAKPGAEVVVRRLAVYGATAQGRVVFRTEREWKAFWDKETNKYLQIKPRAAKLDFPKYTYIAAFNGRRPSTGYSVRIESVLEYPDRLEVLVNNSESADGCPQGRALTYPADMVFIARTAKPAVFKERTTTVPCAHPLRGK